MKPIGGFNTVSHRIHILGSNREEGGVGVGWRWTLDETIVRLLQSSRLKPAKAKPKATGVSWKR